MRKPISAIMAVFALTTAARAETYNLTLQQSIDIAMEKSLSMQSLQHDLQIAEHNLKSATARQRTHVSMNLTVPQYTEMVRQWEDNTGQISFYSVKQLNYSSNLSIDQPLPTDGSVYLRGGLSGIDNYNDDMRSSNLNVRFGFTQPVTSLWYNSIRSALKRAQLDYEYSNKSLKREELNLVYNVSSSYYNLLSLQKSTEIALLDLERQQEAFEISKNKYEAELIREVDHLQMEVDLADAQNNHDISVLNQVSAVNSFKNLLGIELDDEIILSGDMEYKVVEVDPEMAVRLALDNRLEIREREIQIELQKITIKQRRAERLPSGSITGYYEKTGVNTQFMNYGLGSSIENSLTDLRHRPRNFGVGFTVSVPIFDWGESRAIVRAAEIGLTQNLIRKQEVERDIETEVRNLAANVESNLKRLLLLEKNVSVAEKSFEITLQRFTDGDIDSQNLALERNRLNNAYTSHLRAYINYQLTLADLMRRTFYDFENGRPIVES